YACLICLFIGLTLFFFFFFFQAEDGIRDFHVTGVQTCALPISPPHGARQISTCAPSSTSRLPGIRKKWLAGAALRCITANSLSRHTGMPRRALETTVSRLTK